MRTLAPFLALLVGLAASAQRAGRDARDAEWILQEAPRLVSAAERAELQGLRTMAERRQFVARFWSARDPDPATPYNEVRREHEERMDFVEREFGTVERPGWRTDRGRVWVLYGPPDDRTIGAPSQNDGRGFADGYPWEVWIYRSFQGGGERSFELVDLTLTGYRLVTPWDDMPAPVELQPRRP